MTIYTSSTLIGGNGGAGPSSLPHTTLEGPTEGVCECKMHGKVYMGSYMASNGSCFMVTWVVFKNHLLEVGLTQNHREIMTLRTLTIIDLFYFIMCEDPMSRNSIEIAFGWGPGHTYGFTLHLRLCDHTTWFWRCLGMAFGHFLLGSHNFMVMALGSCVKWPQVSNSRPQPQCPYTHDNPSLGASNYAFFIAAKNMYFQKWMTLGACLH